MSTNEKSIAFRIGELLYAMSQWSRPARASIVIVGMLAAIALFWLGHPFLAIVSGFVALGLFWLLMSPPVQVADAGDEAANDAEH
ncbi:hypothetical protein EAT51_19815 [Pseudoxanthomonas winnipegensis]|uniref:hypothetical protein n=1 Tax=Pseudoxanthomonas winnipegensis TaxID=2480810 RepID=UPI00102DE4BB|nr:hypothetical protein [Pseudoxanthomonas winnipegensis]TAA36390.1 hypothetical protein EAT51_19815 [Pseudoxanthomonas winnipegensis]